MYSECQYNDKCKYLHNINGVYSEEIIKERQLTIINSLLLAKLLKLSQEYKISFCRGGPKCTLLSCDSLHYCFHEFIKGNCENKSNCEFGHSIESNYNINHPVLVKRNLDNVYIGHLRPFIILAYNGFKELYVKLKFIT